MGDRVRDEARAGVATLSLVGGRLDPRNGRVRADRRSNARRLAQMLTPFPIFIAAGAFETTDCLILKR